MPIYEYVCPNCSYEFEQLVRNASEESALRCPKCDASGVEKRLSRIATPRSLAPAPATGACGRCGDPNGPCGSA